MPDTTNEDMTLTQSGSSYTVTPAAGYYGVQILEITAQAATAPAWDETNHVDQAYRAYVPVFVAPPAPQVSSISVDGQTVTGSTTANNTSAATAFSFNIAGAIAGATVSVYLDGGTTAIASGTVAADATTITLTTDGKTQIASGSHTFTVKQSIATFAWSCMPISPSIRPATCIPTRNSPFRPIRSTARLRRARR